MPSRQYPNLPDRLLVRLCNLFLAGTKAGGVARKINEDLAKLQRSERVTREQIYALLNEARQRGFFVVRAPLYTILAQAIADLYHIDRDAIVVVDAEGQESSEHVADEASQLALRLIPEVVAGKTRRLREEEDRRGKEFTEKERRERLRVHLGLGAGFTTLSITRNIARELRALSDPPDLTLHALSSGFQVDRPRTSPLGFFGLFDDFGERVAYVGLMASTSVKATDYDTEVKAYPASLAFKHRNEIDIIITSLASATDEHGNLNQFLKWYSDDEGRLKKAGWIGDVQYRPFSARGPITDVQRTKTVTLFELNELVAFARTPGKHVLLVSGPCGDCGHTRETPMEALLTVPELKVWTHIVMDASTAEKLEAAAVAKTHETRTAREETGAPRAPAEEGAQAAGKSRATGKSRAARKDGGPRRSRKR